jgi:hypothetical protein
MPKAFTHLFRSLEILMTRFMLNHFKPLLVALCLSFFISAFAKESDVLGPNEWPETIEAATQKIISLLSEKDRLLVKEPKKENLILYHHGWGRGIRNSLGLWRGNQKLLLSACGKPCDPDEASMKIIEAVWVNLQK